MYYCGICKSIGRNFSQLSRFGLVYEAAVLAILLSMASCIINDVNVTKENCIAHPFKKSYYVNDFPCIEYAAAVNVLLMYFKLQDNWQDDKSILSLSAKRAIKKGFKKAEKKYTIAADAVYFSICQLNKVEKNNSMSIDEASEPFASMMCNIFKWLDDDFFVGKYDILDLLGKIGYNVGKWIYIIDAVSDVDQDKKENSFNVLLQGDHINEKSKIDNIKFILELCLANCADAYEKLISIIEKDIDTNNLNYINAKGVTDNLFYVGMRHITEVKVGKLYESV